MHASLATHPSHPDPSAAVTRVRLLATFRGIRVLTFHGDFLYACRGYELLRWSTNAPTWQSVARLSPAWWRRLTSKTNLSYRLARDGFHALTVLPGGSMVGAVPGAIVTCSPGSSEF